MATKKFSLSPALFAATVFTSTIQWISTISNVLPAALLSAALAKAARIATAAKAAENKS
jgi:hypothetical protein